jgi:outer membrane protein OmpA-like peptidoglycan-associated protein
MSGFGGCVNYLDYGVLGKTTVSNPRGLGLGDFNSYDIAAAVGYASRVGMNMSLGLSLKYVRQVISVYEAWALSSDIGFHYMTSVRGLSAGAVIQNISTKAGFSDTREELPLVVKGGLGYRFPDGKALIAVDISRQIDSERLALNFGGEWMPVDFVSCRAGINSRNDLDTGITAGLGFNHRKLSIDYAYSPYGDLGRTHQITITCRFGIKKGGPDKKMAGMNSEPPASPVADDMAVVDLKKMEGIDIKEGTVTGSNILGTVAASPSKNITITVGKQAVPFALNSAEITNFDTLDEIAGVILKNPAYKIDVVGHTDSIGEKQYNIILSFRRAESVMKYLAGAGVDPFIMSVRGVGYSQPIVPDDTAENQAKNRRVEIILRE